MRMRLKRYRLPVLLAAAVLLTSGTVALADAVTSGDNPNAQPPSSPEPYPASQPCAPVVTGFQEQSEANGFSTVGIHSDTLPPGFANRFQIATYTCLADELKGIVTGILLDIEDRKGQPAGAILLLPSNDTGNAEWRHYLATARPEFTNVENQPNRLIASTPDVHGRALAEMAQTQGSGGSAWAEVIRELKRRDGK